MLLLRDNFKILQVGIIFAQRMIGYEMAISGMVADNWSPLRKTCGSEKKEKIVRK